MLIDGRWYCNDVAVTTAQVVKVGRVAKVFSSDEVLLGSLKGKVVAGPEFIDTALIDVETKDVAFSSEFHGQREANITKAYD